MYIEIFYVILIIFPLSCFFSQCFRSKKFETARYTFKEQCFIISKLLTIEDWHKPLNAELNPSAIC